MTWTERLNRLIGRVGLGAGAAEVLHWAWSEHLPDNIPHRHAYYEICLVGAHGAGQFLTEGVAHALAPGDLFFARPGVVHQIRNLQSPEMELYWLSFTLAPGPADTRLRRFAESSQVVLARAAGDIGSVWRALRAAAEGGATDDELTALATALLLGIVRAGSTTAVRPRPPEPVGPGDEPARRAVRFIHEQLHRPVSVPEVAAASGVSARQLTRLLTRFTGVAPAIYIERARIERACTLLLRTDDPIKMVAARAGYGDVHRFTRAFSRVMGCPPGRFRRSGGLEGTRPPLTEERAGSLV